MQKTWLVFKNEFLAVVARRSFILILVLVPLIGFISTLVISGLQSSGGTDTKNALQELISPPLVQKAEGFVDQSGLVKVIPAGLQKLLISYADEQQVKQALRIGEITSYYIIDPDYLKTGKVVYYRPDFNPLGSLTQTHSITELMEFNLLGGDTQLTSRLKNTLNLETVSLTEQAPRDPTNALTFFLPYVVTMLFYVMILSSASLMLGSVTDEKQNRVMEILMTSITPMQMLTGKIIALGLAGLLQTVVWSGSGFLLLRLGGQSFDLPAAFQLPVSILLWGVVFFVLGYALYGSLMAGVGALVPNLREASQATTVVVIPMIVPLMLISSMISEPNGTLAVVLSLVPFTAPVTMMTRLSATNVPIWQPLLATGLLLATTYLVIRAVAGMFRTQNLLSGQAFSLKLFFTELFGRSRN